MEDTIRQAILNSIEEGKTICTIAREAGVHNSVLYRFMNSKQGLSLANATKLLTYFNITLRPDNKGER